MSNPSDRADSARRQDPPEVTRHIALVMDVDGVISPVKGHPAWGDETHGDPSKFGATVWVSQRLNMRLDALAARPTVRPVWLTSWSDHMRAPMTFPGKDWESAAPDGLLSFPGHRLEDGWWKYTALLTWLEAYPEIDTVIWCDDHLNNAWLHTQDEFDVASGYGLTNTHVAATNLARRGIPLFPIRPRTNTGLTPEHIGQIRRVLTGDEPAPRITIPAPIPLPETEDLQSWAQDPYVAICRDCDPDHWWVGHYVNVIKCPACGRYSVSNNDITDLLNPEQG